MYTLVFMQKNGLIGEIITIELFSEVCISWMNPFLQGIIMDKSGRRIYFLISLDFLQLAFHKTNRSNIHKFSLTEMLPGLRVLIYTKRPKKCGYSLPIVIFSKYVRECVLLTSGNDLRLELCRSNLSKLVTLVYLSACMQLSSPLTALFYCCCYSWNVNLTVFF